MIDANSGPTATPNVLPAFEAEESLRWRDRVAHAAHFIAGSVKAVAVAMELNHVTNELPRFGALAAASEVTGSPMAGAAAFAASTFLIEYSAGRAAAGLLDTQGGQTAMARAARIGRRLFGRKDTDESTLHSRGTSFKTDAAVSLVAGVPVSLAVKQAADPSRTIEDNRRYALRAAAGVTAGTAPLGIAVAEGVARHTAENITLGAAGLVGTVAVVAALQNKLRDKNTNPNYHLTAEEYTELESSLVAQVRAAHGDTVSAVWMTSSSPYANLVRTEELKQQAFHDLDEIMKPYEGMSKFLALVDAREGAGRVVHAFRVSSADVAEPRSGLHRKLDSLRSKRQDKINIAFIRDLVESGQVTDQELTDYYTAKNVDLSQCLSVETNFRVGERAEKVNGLATPDLGYLSIFTEAIKAVDPERGVIFAHLNRAARLSLSGIGVMYEQVAGRELRTPTKGGFDNAYEPVAIPGTPGNTDIFKQLQGFAPPVMYLS